ncbi:MAG TPA: PAS domain-containing protein, partial [Bacteroidia bacterium]|nr:PAS domain-containing protein [Bacteroidia bacterium]
MLNKLLSRQIQKHFGSLEEIPENFLSLLKVISDSYDHYEKDRNMLERSIELSSNEMIELNNKLREETSEVKKAHHNLKTLFENIREVFFSVDVSFKKGKASFKLLQMSPGCLNVYGYSKEDFFELSELWHDVILDEDKTIIDAHFPLMLEGKSIAHEYRIRHKDGSVRWIATKITPTLDENGKLIRMDGVTSDINEKKLSEKKLEEAHNELNKIFNNIDEVLYSVDMVSYKLIQMSAACEKVYGYM